MSFDITAINRTRFSVEGRDSVWLFGYGSLIFKADFDCLEARPASIRGWERRFWQGSHIHCSRGPSGTNREYLERLAQALRALKVNDQHVYAIERHLPVA